jgi:hypothetical protein
VSDQNVFIKTSLGRQESQLEYLIVCSDFYSLIAGKFSYKLEPPTKTNLINEVVLSEAF